MTERKHKSAMNVRIYPVTADRWADFARFFECRGSPHYCWCTAWREIGKKGRKKEETITIGGLTYEQS